MNNKIRNVLNKNNSKTSHYGEECLCHEYFILHDLYIKD